MIDLSDYTAPMRRFIKEREMACVYVLCHGGSAPARIGHALDIHNHVALIQSTNAAEIEVAHLLWTPGKIVAVVIENAVREEMRCYHLRQKWFDVQPQDAVGYVTVISSRLYPNANLVSHQQIIAQLRPQKSMQRNGAI